MSRFNYARFRQCPQRVRELTLARPIWVVGGAARYLLDLQEERPRDWDLLVPYPEWKAVAPSLPNHARPNTHGGWKFADGTTTYDIWPGSLSQFLVEAPRTPVYAVCPFRQTYLIYSND